LIENLWIAVVDAFTKLKDTIQTEFVLEVVVLEDTVLEGMPYERNK
jgi:hypothetical protein